MKTLLTGFERFGKLATNPSELVVQAIAARKNEMGASDLVTEILPTEFAKAGDRIVQLIRAIRPELVISLGVAAGIDAVHLERVALNLDDAESPDNAGVTPKGKLICAEGPLSYWSTLPIEQMSLALQRRGLPVRISNHAGTYVCNHVFYVARHEVECLGIPSRCGFIHVPNIAEANRKETPERAALPLAVIVETIEACIELAQG